MLDQTPGRSKSASTKRRRASSLNSTVRSDILEAAVRLFSQKTFDGTSLKEIAEAVGVGHPLVHYHFGSKEKLWKAAVEHVWSNLERDYRMILQTTVDMQAIDTLKILGRSYAKFCIQYPQHIGLVTNEVRSLSQRFEWLMSKYIKPIHEQLDSIIAKAIKEGDVRDIPIVNLSVNMFISFSHFLSVSPMVKFIYNVDPSDPEVAERHIDLVVDMLFNGIAAKASND